MNLQPPSGWHVRSRPPSSCLVALAAFLDVLYRGPRFRWRYTRSFPLFSRNTSNSLRRETRKKLTEITLWIFSFISIENFCTDLRFWKMWGSENCLQNFHAYSCRPHWKIRSLLTVFQRQNRMSKKWYKIITTTQKKCLYTFHAKYVIRSIFPSWSRIWLSRHWFFFCLKNRLKILEMKENTQEKKLNFFFHIYVYIL